MAMHRLAEQRIAAAEARGELRGLTGEGAPLPPDGLDGLTPEERARLTRDVERARLRGALLLERSGRMLTARRLSGT